MQSSDDMKVAMVNDTYGGAAGSGRVVKLLTEELVRRGFNVSFITYRTVGYLNITGFKFISFAILAMAKRKNLRNFDIVHIHHPMLTVVAGDETNNILTIHGDYLLEFSSAYSPIFSQMFNIWFQKEKRKFKAITCVSPYWSKLRGWCCIPNGIRLEEINEIEPAGERNVLFVGRPDRLKGHDLFERAMGQLPYPYKMLGVYKTFTQREVIAFMKSAYCLVLPSQQEAFPMVILEAWAAGCSVIATDLPTLRSYGQGAIYFLKERTVHCIRSAVQEVVENERLAKNLAKAGLEAVKSFDINRVVEQYIKVYEKCAHAGGRLI